MKYDLFNWALITAIITFFATILLGLATSNDLIFIIMIVVIAGISILLFAKKNPELVNFKAGAAIGLAVLAALSVASDIDIGFAPEDIIYEIIIFAIAFFAAGYFAKLIKRK